MTFTHTFMWCALAAAVLAGPAMAQSHDDHDHETAGAHDDHSGHAKPDAHAGHDHHDEGVVSLTPAELEEFGIRLATAGEGTIEIALSLPGEVRPNDDRVAHIVPRYAGIVTEVRAKIGDRVKKGQTLAIVESDAALSSYPLRTLINGTVIAKHITRGEAVSREKDTYLIADLSSVWVDITLYQRDINLVHLGQNVYIFTGHGPAEASGTISYITPVMDERTRTGTVRVVLPNPDGKWRPGMFITASVVVEQRAARVAVPATAIHTMEEKPVVFVETDHGFKPQVVVLGKAGRKQVEILSGLNPGDRYVSEGGFTLKAELGKGAFGDGHAH